MSRPLKSGIKNNGMIKVTKKVRTFRYKSGRVLLRVFCVIVSEFFFHVIVFFIGIAANLTIIPEYPSLAQT